MNVEVFSKQIVSVEKDKLSDIAKLRNRKNLLVLYGIGDCANAVCKFLGKHQIITDIVCVDENSMMKIYLSGITLK